MIGFGYLFAVTDSLSLVPLYVENERGNIHEIILLQKKCLYIEMSSDISEEDCKKEKRK